MGTHPIFESDFDCLTDLDNNDNSSPTNMGAGPRWQHEGRDRLGPVVRPGLDARFAGSNDAQVPSRWSGQGGRGPRAQGTRGAQQGEALQSQWKLGGEYYIRADYGRWRGKWSEWHGKAKYRRRRRARRQRR